MAEERGLQLPHKLSLEERKKLTVSGVAEVVSFEESAVVLRTARGGQVAVEGMVSALIYEEPRREGGFFTRLFG